MKKATHPERQKQNEHFNKKRTVIMSLYLAIEWIALTRENL